MKISFFELLNTSSRIYFWFRFFFSPLLCPQIILHRLNGHSRLSSGMTVHPLGGNRAQLQHSNLHWAVWDRWRNICEQWQLALKVLITIISSYLCINFKTVWPVFISISLWSDWKRSLERFQGIWVTFLLPHSNQKKMYVHTPVCWTGRLWVSPPVHLFLSSFPLSVFMHRHSFEIRK